MYETPGVKRNLLTASEKESVRLVLKPSYLEVNAIQGQLVSQEQYLKELACKADFILIGTVRNKASQLTESRSFVFTDYEFNVDEIFKKKSELKVQKMSSITVTNPGGAVSVNGKIIDVEVQPAKRFKTTKKYFLFLQYVTDSYKVFDIEGAFEIIGANINRVSTTNNPFSNRIEKISDLINIIDNSTTQCSK